MILKDGIFNLVNSKLKSESNSVVNAKCVMNVANPTRCHSPGTKTWSSDQCLSSMVSVRQMDAAGQSQ